jgi:hypothetical protein
LNPEISLWAGNPGFKAHSGFMPKRTTDLTAELKRERLELFHKSNLALRKAIAKRQKQLDASQNALRAVEQAIAPAQVPQK